MKSGKENFVEKYIDPEAAKRAVEAQQKAGKRLIKAREAGRPPAETRSPADLKEELDKLFAEKEKGEG